MTEQSFDYDLIVIGSGPAGEKAAAQAAYFKKRVALVERDTKLGGAAVHWGTLPSKTLRESCLYLSGFRQRKLYGLADIPLQEISARALMQREQSVVDSENNRVKINLDRHHVDLYTGSGSFRDPHTILVTKESGETKTLTGEIILIATGTRPERPSNVPFDHPDVLDSDTILRIEHIPKSMAVLGGGVIGCEYATMFATMGVTIALIEGRDRLLSFLDNEVSDMLTDQIRYDLGIDLHLGDGVERVVGLEAGGVEILLKSGKVLQAEKLLFSGGRRGNTEALNLENIGLAADSRGRLTVNEVYQTMIPNVYAAGDVIGFPALAATSMEQGRVAMRHAFQLNMQKKVNPLLPFGIYTVPEISMIGETEESCKQKGLDYEIGRAFYLENARGKIIGDQDGMLKLIFDPETHELLGVHMIGALATELLHIGLLVMDLKGNLETLIQLVFNYPTLAEVYKYAAYNGLGNLAIRKSRLASN